MNLASGICWNEILGIHRLGTGSDGIRKRCMERC